MRVVQNVQMEIGEVDVSKVKFDLKSRDDIPKILRGLQHLYMDLALRTKLFELLEEHVAPKTDKRNGRPGMTLWRIFVCGVVRLDLNIDYDRLHELVNQHNTLREMLGHGAQDKDSYHYQTLKDNVSLFTPELLDKINQLVVNAGYVLVKKKENEALRGRCDSFVVETDVHYPTDINLLDDAEHYLNKAQASLAKLEQSGLNNEFDIVRQLEIAGFMQHAIRQIDQTKRRVILGEVIPHGEKVFSIFEPHTEWVSKGKAGVPVELGVKVCILEDQYQFILHHQVMQQMTDDQVAVSMVAQAKQRFANLNACSFDKGFHSPENQLALKAQLELVALPRKGKLSQSAQAAEQSAGFVKARRAHAAGESAINALEVHGLDRCPDHGFGGFKRYVALAVVARNIHRIGALLWQQEQKRAHRKKKYSHRAPPDKRAA